MEALIAPSLVGMGFAAALMLLTIGLSAWQRLGLEWNLAVATVRTIVQLLVVGYLLAIVFSLRTPWAVLAIIAAMAGIATVVARNQISQKIPNLVPIVGGSILISTAFTLAYVVLLVLRPKLWYDPQYLVPLAGILLGNAMNTAALAGERFVSTLNNSQLEIETHLSLGATPRQATAQYRREAIKAGITPTLNSMMLVGIVTLPGIITGQLLSGVDPRDAALYQMLIMFMLAIAALITTIVLISSLDRQFFNQAAQLKRF